jgi:hypothetical protein
VTEGSEAMYLSPFPFHITEVLTSPYNGGHPACNLCSIIRHFTALYQLQCVFRVVEREKILCTMKWKGCEQVKAECLWDHLAVCFVCVTQLFKHAPAATSARTTTNSWTGCFLCGPCRIKYVLDI